MLLTKESIHNLYASHADLIKRGIVLWQNQTGKVVASDGIVGIADVE